MRDLNSLSITPIANGSISLSKKRMSSKTIGIFIRRDQSLVLLICRFRTTLEKTQQTDILRLNSLETILPCPLKSSVNLPYLLVIRPSIMSASVNKLLKPS